MAKKTQIVAPPREPYSAPRLSSDIVYAVKAIFNGAATAEQQGVFSQWLIAEVCRKDDMSFRPGEEGERATCFAEGKRFVALCVVKALNMPPDAVAAMRAAEALERGNLATTRGDDIERE